MQPTTRALSIVYKHTKQMHHVCDSTPVPQQKMSQEFPGQVSQQKPWNSGSFPINKIQKHPERSWQMHPKDFPNFLDLLSDDSPRQEQPLSERNTRRHSYRLEAVWIPRGPTVRPVGTIGTNPGMISFLKAIIWVSYGFHGKKTRKTRGRMGYTYFFMSGWMILHGIWNLKNTSSHFVGGDGL